jgi:hypothetical protein
LRSTQKSINCHYDWWEDYSLPGGKGGRRPKINTTPRTKSLCRRHVNVRRSVCWATFPRPLPKGAKFKWITMTETIFIPLVVNSLGGAPPYRHKYKTHTRPEIGPSRLSKGLTRPKIKPILPERTTQIFIIIFKPECYRPTYMKSNFGNTGVSRVRLKVD